MSLDDAPFVLMCPECDAGVFEADENGCFQEDEEKVCPCGVLLRIVMEIEDCECDDEDCEHAAGVATDVYAEVVEDG
jgi:hypothetical protein